MQNLAYRAEIMDWLVAFDDSSEKIPTRAELEKYASYNKYEEILNLEKLKISVIENKICLEDGSCNACDFKIQSNPCSEEKLASTEYALNNHGYFVSIASSKIINAIMQFKKQIKQFEK